MDSAGGTGYRAGVYSTVLLSLVPSAVASETTLRGDAPTRATVNATERAYQCASADWTLLRVEPTGSSWSVTLCGVVQMITITRVAGAWGFRTDLDLRPQAVAALGCSDLVFTFVDPGSRSVRGCGADATYTDAGVAGWALQQLVHSTPSVQFGGAAPPVPAAAGPGYAEAAAPLVLGDEPVLGDPNARFVVLDFTDFGCPPCARALPSLEALVANPEIQVRSRAFPLDGQCNPALGASVRPERCAAAEAALCAHRQGRYWEYAALLYAGQAELGEELFTRSAAAVGLEPVAFGQCRADPAIRARVVRDAESGTALKIPGTPTRFVLGLRDGDWVMPCGEVDAIDALIEAAAAGRTLPWTGSETCWP